MIRRPIQDYFFFGTAVRYLQNAEAGWRIADSSERELFVRSNLRMLFEDMEKLTLKISSLTDSARTLRRLLKELETSDDDATLTADQARQMTAAVKELRTTLEAELRATYAYSLTPKRIDVAKLIEAPASLFTPDVFERLPDIARFDLIEGARCIAFEVPTAAAFHMMRAIEAVLRAFYATTVTRGRRAKMWGEIIADLRSRRAGKEHSVLLNHLDHIRGAFRNPTQHPDARYDIHEAQDLWSLAVDAINRMAQHFPKGAT
jgi:hypothetical protein